MNQIEKYRESYRGKKRLRWILSFDVRYRCRRLNEVLELLNVNASSKHVLDVGFGGGHLLKCFHTTVLYMAQRSRSRRSSRLVGILSSLNGGRHSSS